MDTSDDVITDIFGGGDSDEMPIIAAQNPSKTASPVADSVGEGSDRQKKLAASLVTKNWDAPVLGKRGLVGL